MTLPMQIQREAEQLAQVEQALYAPPQANPEPPAEVAPEPQAAAPVPEVPAPPAPVEPPPPAVDWEQKYRSLQGVFNSQVPALQQQLREMQGQMEELKKAKAPEPPPKPEADPKDAEVFGADVVEMVVRTAKGLINPVVTDLQTRLGKLEQLADTLNHTSAVTAEEVFFRALEAAVPNWETINQDPRFGAWLDQVDPVYRQPRRAALNLARQQLDSKGVVSIFTVFQETLKPPPAPAPAPRQPSLEQQLVPGTTAGAPTPTAPAAKPVISQKEIEAFYNEVAQGKWRGREAQADAREQEFHLAYREGRVKA